MCNSRANSIFQALPNYFWFLWTLRRPNLSIIRSMSLFSTELAYSFQCWSVQMLLTRCSPICCCGGRFLFCATHWMIRALQNTMQQVSLQEYLPHWKTLATYQVVRFHALSGIFLKQSWMEPALTAKTRAHFLLGFQNFAFDFVKFSDAREGSISGVFLWHISSKAQSISWSFPLNLTSSSDSTLLRDA